MVFLVLLGGCMQYRGAAKCSIAVQSAAHMVYCMVSQWLQGGLGQPIPTPTNHRGKGVTTIFRIGLAVERACCKKA